MEVLRDHKDVARLEVTPQHLSPRRRRIALPDGFGTCAQKNPPVRDRPHRDGIWRGIAQGIMDVIGSDHAPHTLDEKDKAYPDTPPGMTGVQTLVTIMLDHVNAGRLR